MTEPFSIETVEKMWKSVQGTDDKLDILFRISLDTARRTKKLERRKRFDTTISALGGFFGGVAAVIGSLFLRIKHP
jgi:hypothetical protein